MTETLSATIEERTLPAEQAIAAAQEQLAPQERPLPGFEPPPYDAASWNRRLASKQRAVLSAKAAWKSAADKASTLKKTWERETDEQDELYRVMDNERRQAEGELVQPSLRQVANGAAGSSCRYEQETGGPCPGCIMLRKGGCLLPDPEDTEHADLVRDALEQADDREELHNIVRINFSATREQVEAWSVDEAREVGLFFALSADLPSDANHPVLPEALGALGDAPPAEQTTDEVMADAKVCLCAKPNGKKRCKTCGGTVTGKGK
jgi:hypothetical protein